MNKKEFSTLCTAIRAAYPKSNMFETDDTIEFWYTMLKDIAYSVAESALLNYISTNKFPPSIADLREYSTNIISKPILSYGEAWGTVKAAIAKYGIYGYQEAIEMFDEMTLACVKELGWHDMCQSEAPETVRANFRIIYEEKAKKAANERVIPEFVKKRVLEIRRTYIEDVPKEKFLIEEEKQPEPQKATQSQIDNFLKKAKEAIRRGVAPAKSN